MMVKFKKMYLGMKDVMKNVKTTYNEALEKHRENQARRDDLAIERSKKQLERYKVESEKYDLLNKVELKKFELQQQKQKRFDKIWGTHGKY